MRAGYLCKIIHNSCIYIGKVWQDGKMARWKTEFDERK